MRTLLLACVAAFACACTPHEVRCDGRLEPINSSVTIPGTPAHAPADGPPGVP